jgi:hypothetical protein
MPKLKNERKEKKKSEKLRIGGGKDVKGMTKEKKGRKVERRGNGEREMEDERETTQRQDDNRQEPKERQDKTIERQKHDQTRLD